ncbi:hypothetical protein JZO66_08030 [Enterococcus sp. DIV0242_7C1]|uniref:Uncharacterized protein n=1 Tax=Candidatus Enterococcus dunnyi TaxID=1834192 RepID=A0A200JE27_9ENTE|nr:MULTISPECIES: hypothetical protein [unclassified Enterococcus]MBO0470492.1 hypothetical protein [Enterococcus sp. DIV0242_7C1]OUZ34855.1 hypothetical protein A5889_000330 [Enterococcus sp. 9D6_DIV0238]
MIKKYFMFVLAIFITGFWSIAAEAETIVVTPNHIIKDQKDYYLDGHTWYNDGSAIDSSTLFLQKKVHLLSLLVQKRRLLTR